MNWLLLPTLAGYGLAAIGFVGWLVDSRDLKKTRVAYWNERDEKIKEIDRLDKDLQGTRATIKARDIEIADLHAQNKSLDEDNACMAEANAGIAKERDEWMRLYNELLTTYHDAQGDALTMEVAPDPPKRTRKKAGQQ